MLELIGGSSQAQMFFKIGAFRNFAHFTGKQLCWSLLFIKLLAWRPATLLKRDSNKVFSCEIYENFKNTVFYRTPPVAACVIDLCDLPLHFISSFVTLKSENKKAN